MLLNNPAIVLFGPLFALSLSLARSFMSTALTPSSPFARGKSLSLRSSAESQPQSLFHSRD